MRLGLLGAVSRTIMIVPGCEIPYRNASHAGRSRRSSGLNSSPAALGHFEYFGFPLSLSFQGYSIPVNSLITDAILLMKWQWLASKNCDILVYYAASSINLLTTFRDKPSVPPFLISENGTNRLCRNVVITQKNAVLSYVAVEVWNHYVQVIESPTDRPLLHSLHE